MGFPGTIFQITASVSLLFVWFSLLISEWPGQGRKSWMPGQRHSWMLLTVLLVFWELWSLLALSCLPAGGILQAEWTCSYLFQCTLPATLQWKPLWPCYGFKFQFHHLAALLVSSVIGFVTVWIIVHPSPAYFIGTHLPTSFWVPLFLNFVFHFFIANV